MLLKVWLIGFCLLPTLSTATPFKKNENNKDEKNKNGQVANGRNKNKSIQNYSTTSKKYSSVNAQYDSKKSGVPQSTSSNFGSNPTTTGYYGDPETAAAASNSYNSFDNYNPSNNLNTDKSRDNTNFHQKSQFSSPKRFHDNKFQSTKTGSRTNNKKNNAAANSGFGLPSPFKDSRTVTETATEDKYLSSQYGSNSFSQYNIPGTGGVHNSAANNKDGGFSQFSNLYAGGGQSIKFPDGSPSAVQSQIGASTGLSQNGYNNAGNYQGIGIAPHHSNNFQSSSHYGSSRPNNLFQSGTTANGLNSAHSQGFPGHSSGGYSQQGYSTQGNGGSGGNRFQGHGQSSGFNNGHVGGNTANSQFSEHNPTNASPFGIHSVNNPFGTNIGAPSGQYPQTSSHFVNHNQASNSQLLNPFTNMQSQQGPAHAMAPQYALNSQGKLCIVVPDAQGKTIAYYVLDDFGRISGGGTLVPTPGLGQFSPQTQRNFNPLQQLGQTGFNNPNPTNNFNNFRPNSQAPNNFPSFPQNTGFSHPLNNNFFSDGPAPFNNFPNSGDIRSNNGLGSINTAFPNQFGASTGNFFSSAEQQRPNNFNTGFGGSPNFNAGESTFSNLNRFGGSSDNRNFAPANSFSAFESSSIRNFNPSGDFAGSPNNFGSFSSVRHSDPSRYDSIKESVPDNLNFNNNLRPQNVNYRGETLNNIRKSTVKSLQ